MGMHRRVEKVNRFWQRVVMAVVFATLVWMGVAQETPQPPQPPAPTHQDAPAPEPHPELKPLVEDIRTLLRDGKLQDALSKADDLLQEARARGDKVGEAYALRFRALALQRTRQTAPDQLPEVASVWASALALWREIGDGALQVEALLGQAYCVWRASPDRLKALVQEALQLAKGEAKRPLAVATALHNAGVDWYGVGQLPVAETLWQQALAIFENLAPNSLEMASTLNNLGTVAYSRGDLARAEQLFQQALAIYEKLAPNSLQVAGTLHNLGSVAQDRGDLARAEQLYQQALAIREKLAPNSLEVADTLHNLGNVARDRGDLARAEQLFQQALAIYEKLAPNSLEVADTLHNLGNVAYDRGDLARAEQLFQQALAIYEKLAPNSLQVATTLHNLGSVAHDRGDLAAAERYLQQALAIYEKLAPNSLQVATTLHNLGNVAYSRGDLARAEQLFQQALAIREKLAPNSLQVASTLNTLGSVAANRGDLARAEQLFQQALAIREKLAPNSLQVAGTLNNLGSVAADRGDLARAEQLYQQALAIYEKLAPNSLDVADTLNNLGSVAANRGDLARAEQLFQQALAIYEKLAPNSLQVATTLHNLGNVAADRGDLARAERLYQQALAIYEKLAPNSLDVADTLNTLGSVAANRGDLARAEQLFQQALAIREKLAPNSLQVATTLNNLGSVAHDRGDLAAAERYLQQALAIYEKLAPNSLQVASTLQNLANLARQQKNYPQAQRYLARALEIYETQRAAIPDPETKTAFAERYFNAYTLQAQLALDQQQPQQAALALERSRARTLAELMFTRALPVPTNAPQALKDLIAQQEQLQRELLLLARQQRQTDPDDTNALQRLQAQARQLADRHRRLDRRLRQQFPTYADLLNPQPPNLQQVQAALDATTVLLYHAFADKELLIVAVSRQTVRGYRVKVDPRTLEKDLAEFQRVVAKPPLERTASERRKLLALGQQLYATLIKPAEPSLKNATTVLLCPEGALNQLPWGALIVAVDKQGRPTYWVERVALGITLSAGVYLQAKAVRPAPRGVAIAAVSQYRQRQVAQAPKTAQLVRRSGRALGDLPAVRQEVAQLRRELSKLGVVIAQESNATPARARQMAQNARVVHFACHARADDVDPLGSGLLLAPAGSDEGLLTAAEVVSRWRLRADVVMLSACETAVGQVRRYEGMYGLARAFLFAGSRSVGASLWRVEDVSTARLMEAFYRGYVSGVPKAEALRRAQLALLRDKRYADPYYWSGFVLIGAER
jgi:CHAT domain-containing protein/tetratricopeptide (TPR) repeat protein